MRCSTWRSMYWSGDYWCRQRWNHQFTLAANINKIWSRAGTRTSKISRRCSISPWGRSLKFIRNSEFIYYDIWFPSLDENDSVSWSSNQVGKSESACLLRFSLVSGKDASHSEANEKWKDQISAFQQDKEYAELSGIDWEPVEFKWNIFTGFTSIEILRQIQRDLKARHTNPDQFEGRFLFMSMFNDHGLDKELKSLRMYLKFRTSKWLRKEVSARTLVILRSWK